MHTPLHETRRPHTTALSFLLLLLSVCTQSCIARPQIGGAVIHHPLPKTPSTPPQDPPLCCTTPQGAFAFDAIFGWSIDLPKRFRLIPQAGLHLESAPFSWQASTGPGLFYQFDQRPWLRSFFILGYTPSFSIAQTQQPFTPNQSLSSILFGMRHALTLYLFGIFTLEAQYVWWYTPQQPVHQIRLLTGVDLGILISKLAKGSKYIPRRRRKKRRR